MLKLTEDQHRELLDMIEDDGYKVLVNIVLPQLLKVHTDRMLSVDFSKNTHELLISRASLEGATKLATDISNIKKHLRTRE